MPSNLKILGVLAFLVHAIICLYVYAYVCMNCDHQVAVIELQIFCNLALLLAFQSMADFAFPLCCVLTIQNLVATSPILVQVCFLFFQLI